MPKPKTLRFHRRRAAQKAQRKAAIEKERNYKPPTNVIALAKPFRFSPLVNIRPFKMFSCLWGRAKHA